MLAVRDEDVTRAWDPPGEWWPELPGVTGVRDRRAGGAWLAARDDRLSVLLNRADPPSRTPRPSAPPLSRGTLVLSDITGAGLGDAHLAEPFNLVSAHPGGVTVASWNGDSLAHHVLEPGMHMIAHHDVDDLRSARIREWLPEFAQLAGAGEDWQKRWIELLTRTTQLPAEDDRAIIRDNHSHGFPTVSLLVCLAEIPFTGGQVRLESVTLQTPARWSEPTFVRAPLSTSVTASPTTAKI